MANIRRILQFISNSVTSLTETSGLLINLEKDKMVDT